MEDDVADQEFPVGKEDELRELHDQNGEEETDKTLLFLDSVDSFLATMDSLSATLREGWMELSIARHSMGPWRINAALLDLKPHDASTSVIVCHDFDGMSNEKQSFVLRKSGTSVDCSSGSDTKVNRESSEATVASKELLCDDTSFPTDDESEKLGASVTSLQLDEQVKKEQTKLLSTFGVLVSPKLSSAQFSFTSALDMIVEAANMRKQMLVSYNQVSEQLNRAT